MAAPCTKRDEKQSSSDLFITPIEALNAIKPHLMKDLGDHAVTDVLDPCSGLGDISHWLSLNTTCNVIANELYPCPDKDKLVFDPQYEQDFLDDNNTIPIADIIVANPPYNKAVEFVCTGFDYAPIQWHFLRLSFLESQTRFQQLFNMGKLTDVYIFTFRVSCDKGYAREETANSVCYAWYRFDKYYCGQPKLHWLTK